MSAQSVIIISGGTSFDEYREYIEYLKNQEVAKESFVVSIGWKERIQDQLGNQFEVFIPRMPNRTNAVYEEWRIWFERLIPFLSDKVVLIGHSLGGIFLAKYLSENEFPHTIRKTILIAAPYGDTPGGSLGTFRLSHPFAKFGRQGGEVTLFHSTDDPVVPYGDAKKYSADLPAAKLLTFSDRGHFNMDSFPELVTEIAGLK